MKKSYSFVVVLVALVFILSSCEIPFLGGKSEPFQPGALEAGVYVNSQADIMYIVPLDCIAYLGEETTRQINTGDERIKGDFLCTNPATGSTLFVAYYDAPRNYSVDKEIDSIVEEVIKIDGKEDGINFTIEDTFEYKIANKDFTVVDLALSTQGITVHEYLCLENSGDYPCVFIILPSPGSESDSFENMAEMITEI